MDEAVEQSQPDGDKAEPEVDEPGQCNGREVYAPDPWDVDHENGESRENIASFSRELVDEQAEPVRVVLLELVEHVERKLQRDEPKGRAPIAADDGIKSENEKPGEESAVDPVVDQSLHSVVLCQSDGGGADRIENARILRGPAGGFEFGVPDAFAGGRFVRGGRDKFSGADGFGEVGAAGGVVVDGVEEAGEAIGADVEEGAGGVVAVDKVDEGVWGTEGEGLVGAGSFDEAGAAGSVDAAEADGGAAGIGGEFFRGDQNVTGWSAADRRGFVYFARVVLRINGRAAGEDGELRGEKIGQVLQCLAVNNAVGVGVASLFAAQAVDEDVWMLTTGELGAEFFRIGRIGGEDAVRFAGEAAGGFFRGNEGGDVPAGLEKKIRASFTGVTTTGEEDARS